MNGPPCLVCRVRNAAGEAQCRVCRTPLADGVLPLTQPGDIPGFSMLRALPGPVFLFILAVALLRWWGPVTAPFSLASVRTASIGSRREDRHAELSQARKEIVILHAELETAVIEGSPVPPGWGERLVKTRKTWQIYGDATRNPEMGGVEVKLCTVVLELVSIESSFGGMDRVDALRRLDELDALLAASKEELRDAIF